MARPLKRDEWVAPTAVSASLPRTPVALSSSATHAAALRATDAPTLVHWLKRGIEISRVGLAASVPPLSAASLEERDSVHEARLLYQAGRRPSPMVNGLIIDSPPCALAAKNQCVGQTQELQGLERFGGSVVLMAYMSPPELNNHYRTGWKPCDERLCVLCARFYVGHIFAVVQCEQIPLPRDVVVQTYRNKPPDTLGGYKKEYCWMPSFSEPNGVIAPVAMFRHELLRAFRNPKGHICIDQSLQMACMPTPASASKNLLRPLPLLKAGVA